MEKRDALIQLNLIPGVGSITIRRLLDFFHDPSAVFTADPALLREAGGRSLVQRVIDSISQCASGTEAQNEQELAHERGIHITTFCDSDYPACLKNIPDPPPVLYIKGNLIQEDSVAVAIVGTRKTTPYGVLVAQRFSKELAAAGMTIVSGLAEGIDAAAHAGALEAGGRTVAVVGHGLNHLYPPVHRELAEKIARQGAVISEFPINFPPLRENFPRRNRIIAGLSLGVLVVEAPRQSGALITAREALEQGRDVFAVPGPITSVNSRGVHQLIKEGARLVDEPYEILQELSLPLKEQVTQWSSRVEKSPVIASLSSEETSVFEAIPSGGSAFVDTLVASTEMKTSQLLRLLTGLEIKGVIKQIPGQGYSRLS